MKLQQKLYSNSNRNRCSWPYCNQDVTVTVTDANDNAPVFTSDAAVTIDENTTDVVTLTTTDADTNPTVTYSITGGADELALQYTASRSLNYTVLTLNQQNSYEAYTATDKMVNSTLRLLRYI